MRLDVGCNKVIQKCIFLVVATLFHSFLTLWSFWKLFGMGHMHPESRPIFAEKVWGVVGFITWQPTLWLTHRIRIGDYCLFDKFPWWLILTIINSVVSVCIIYLLVKWLIIFIKNKEKAREK